MQIIHELEHMQSHAGNAIRLGKRVGFVPTMGYLHEAHLSLIRIARKVADEVVVSIFVNPTQFGPSEDFDRYPRDADRDHELCRKEGADLVFSPSTEAMYAPEPRVYVAEEEVSATLEGAFRPGHFRGVLTVVAKLLNLVRPNVAVFGEKDAQQLFLVRRMVKDLNLPVEVVAGPLIREEDGLAMSSRNVYLSNEERADALSLNRALTEMQRRYAAGEVRADVLKEAGAQRVQSTERARLNYLELVDDTTFRSVERATDRCRAVVAAHLGTTRLLDNRRLKESP